MPGINKPLELIQFDCFSEQLDKLQETFPRMHDVHGNIDFTLARNPLEGQECEGEKNYRIYETIPIGPTPSFRVLYYYSKPEEKIYMISIAAVVAPENDEDS